MKDIPISFAPRRFVQPSRTEAERASSQLASHHCREFTSTQHDEQSHQLQVTSNQFEDLIMELRSELKGSFGDRHWGSTNIIEGSPTPIRS